jgi:O-acetyl-ADP-ribose deacetylase (regulator of RNase III)
LEPVIPPRRRNPAISSDVSEVIERCVAKAPDDRFANFDQVAAALSAREASEPSPWNRSPDPALAEYVARFETNRSKYIDSCPSEGFDDVYHFPANRVLRILSGDIIAQRSEVIVSSDDNDLSMGGGVSGAILRAAGLDVFAEAQRYVPVRQGRVVVTSAGRLSQRFIFHGVSIAFGGVATALPSRDIIAEIIDSCIYNAETLNARSISFPLLGTGVGGFSPHVCLDTMFRVLGRMLLKRPTCVKGSAIVIHTSLARHP